MNWLLQYTEQLIYSSGVYWRYFQAFKCDTQGKPYFERLNLCFSTHTIFPRMFLLNTSPPNLPPTLS